MEGHATDAGTRRTIAAAFLANLGIALAKFVAAVLTNSASMFAEAIHSVADTGNQALLMRHSRYIVPAGLHAKMQFEFVEPVRVGMRVRTHGKIIDKYERRDRHYMVTQFETREEGTAKVLTRGQFTQMIFPKSGVHRETTNR